MGKLYFNLKSLWGIMICTLLLNLPASAFDPPHNIGNGAHGMSESPSAVVYNNQLYLFFQGRGDNKQLQYRIEKNWGDWTLASKVDNLGMTNSPSAVVYKNKVYIFHHDSNNGSDLWYTTFDGNGFSSDKKLENVRLDNSPGAVVYNNKLYVFHEGNSGRDLWYSVFDGNRWERDVKVPNTKLTNSPGAAVYNGKLYVFHQDSNKDGYIWYNTFNGYSWSGDKKITNARMCESPIPVVYNGKLHVFYQGAYNSKELWSLTMNGNSFQNRKCGNIKLTGHPAPVVHNGALRVFHQDVEKKGYIRETLHTGNWQWRRDLQLAAFNMKYDGYLYKKFKDFTMPGTHNGYTAPPLFFGGNNNTEEYTPFQLDQGIRMIEIDFNYSYFPYNIGLERNVGVIHGKFFGSSTFGQRTTRDVLREVSDWLEANPTEVIILKIDSPSKVSYDDVKHFMKVGGLYDKLYMEDADWSEMRPIDVINAGKQVILMGTNTGDMASNIESQMGNSASWGADTPEQLNPRMSNKERDLYVPAMYCTTKPMGFGSSGEAKIVNEYDFAKNYIMKGWRESARRPFVFVHDFSTYGDVMDLTYELNMHYRSFRGKVVDANGNRIKDVRFECTYSSDNKKVVAWTNGEFNFPVRTGETITVKVSKSGVTFAQSTYTHTNSNYSNYDIVITTGGANMKSAKLEKKYDFKYINCQPNPFSDYTQINFSLDQASDVVINCYNVTGQQIDRIAAGHLDAGKNNVKWNTSSLEKGIYFIQISANGKTETAKLIKK